MHYSKVLLTRASQERYKIKPYLTLSIILLLGTTQAVSPAQSLISEKSGSKKTQLPKLSFKVSSSIHQVNRNPVSSRSLLVTASATSTNVIAYDWYKILPVIAIILSTLSFCLSGWSLFYNVRKDRRIRKQSIDDDYWIRKVIGPISIEPMLKTLLELITDCPADRTETKFSAELVSQYHDSYVAKLSKLALNTSALGLIDEKLGNKTAEAIDKIQDLLIEYCFNNGEITANFPKSEKKRSEFQLGIKKIIIKIVHHIKLQHNSIE